MTKKEFDVGRQITRIPASRNIESIVYCRNNEHNINPAELGPLVDNDIKKLLENEKKLTASKTLEIQRLVNDNKRQKKELKKSIKQYLDSVNIQAETQKMRDSRQKKTTTKYRRRA